MVFTHCIAGIIVLRVRSMVKINITFLVFLIVCSTQTLAQSIDHDHLSINYYQGPLITHRESIDQSLRGLYPYGLQIAYSEKTQGDKDWHGYWEYPHYGVSVSYLELGDREVLGKVLLCNLFFEKHLATGWDKIHLSYRISTGVAYSNTIYNDNINPLNLFVSSPVNISFETNFLLHYRLTKQIGLFLGPQLSHFSNGASKFPNIGINVPSIKLGLSYSYGDEKERSVGSKLEFEKAQYNLLRFAVSLNSAGIDSNDPNLAYLFSYERVWNVHPRISLVGSTDLIFSNTVRKILKDTDANRTRIGIAVGAQLEWGRFAFTMQYGLYVYRPEQNVYKSTYSRLGFIYTLNDRMQASLKLRSHLFRAELFEWGISYRLK